MGEISKHEIKRPRSFDNLFENIDQSQDYFVSFEIFIKDSGLGIRKEDINKLFLNFGKLADKEGMNKSGTGLGLSICKNIIEKMGGSVRVESEGIGFGTTFIISITSKCKLSSDSLKEMKKKLKNELNLGSSSANLI